ncbi:MAG: hypothetical protein ABSD73_08200 [Candidatus Bathyarchaeia archaeon]|jgi:hypothetical protein
MAPISEQERLIALDLGLISNSTTYAFPSTLGTIHDYGNITIPNTGLVMFKFSIDGGLSGFNCRLKVGTIYVWALSTSVSYSQTTFFAAVWLAAGTYDVLFEGNYVSNSAHIYFMYAGYTLFNDIQAATFAVYSSGIPLTVARRNTPLGPLSQATYAIQVYAVTASAKTNLENVGDNLTNGVSVSIDSVQVNWTERLSPDNTNGFGVSGRVFLPYSVGTAHTITFSLRNSNTNVYVSVVACPWILGPVNHSPLNLTFSQLSTINVILNPLWNDPTKFIGVGIQRGISFGTATDYYNSASGTGLMNYSYMIDTPDISQVNLFVNGWGGCIEVIGVDLR